MLIYQEAQACGKLAVELARHKNGQVMSFTGPITVASSIFKTIRFETMFPYDVVKSLKAVDIEIKQSRLSGPKSRQVNLLRQALKVDCVPILYVGVGVGHWVTLWGFDEKSQEFLVFDSSKEADVSRKPNGLNRYDADTLIDMAHRLVLTQRISNLVGRLWPRFRAEPGTVIFA